MNIIVGLVTINNPDMLKESLESYWANTKAQLVIVNNGGKTPDIESIAGAANYMLIDLPKQISLAAAWNIILERESDYTVITNDDILYSPNWLDNLIKAMVVNPDAGIIQPYNTLSAKPIDFPDNYNLVDIVGDIPTDNFKGCCFGINRLAQLKMADRETSFKDEFYKGLFDESFYPFGSEDQDYYLRMQKAGFKVKTCFNSYIHHYTGVTMNKLYTPAEFKFFVEKNANKMHNKHRARGDNG